jgi:MmyB-like transcription regulator ligand binding domain
VLDERGDEPDRAEHVGGDDRFGRGEELLGPAPVLDPHDPRHRDQDVEVRVPGQHLLGGRVDAGRIAAVDLHGVDAGMVLDRLSDTPALILSNLGETLVQNRMADALFGDKSGYTGLARSEIYRWFTDPAERRRYPEHDRDRQSRAQVANLRAAYGSMGPRSRAGEFARALQKASPEFAALWERHEVARRFEDHKTLIHPELGPIEVDCQVLFTEDQSQALLVLTAPPRTEGYEKLQLLGVLGQQRFAESSG